MNVTLLSCTPDATSELFQRHLQSVKETCRHLSGVEHIIIDNNRAGTFNHAREINRAMAIGRGRFLVTLDDDVIMRGDWLNGLLAAAQRNNAAVVGGIHRYDDEWINHSGAYVVLDGHTGHYLGELKKDAMFPYVCSAVMLIDTNKCRDADITFDEGFQKYYQETDFCLRVWQEGEVVVSTPQCDIFHLVGGAMAARTDGKTLDRLDHLHFSKKWVDNGALNKVLEKIENRLTVGGSSHLNHIHQVLELYRLASSKSDEQLFREVIRLSDHLEHTSHCIQLVGGAHFHLGRIELARGNISTALTYLRLCLGINPRHLEAQRLIRENETHENRH